MGDIKKNLGEIGFRFQVSGFKIAAVLAAIILAGWVGFQIFSSPLSVRKEVVIKEGEGVYAVADALKEEGIIKNKFIFVVYTLATGNERKLQAGRYIFNPGATIPIIVYSMARGLAESNDIEVTIPEGANIWEIDKILTKVLLTKKGEFTRAAIRREGRLFPDTYRIKNQNLKIKNQNDNVEFKNEAEIVNEILEKMTVNFEVKIKELFKDLSTQEREEIIIVASMLEKEARTEEDMRWVAGVIKTRLEKRMPLQVDATVSYGVCLRELESLKFSEPQSSKFKYCDVSQVPVGAEIKIDGPYNTYTRAGLPPGPIANPGIKAIEAAINPADTSYLYYLSTRDGSRIIFSKTAAEHAANRRKYLGL